MSPIIVHLARRFPAFLSRDPLCKKMSSSGLYSASSLTGTVTTYKRANYVRLSNPVVGTPAAIFIEETATTLPDGTVVVQPIDGELVRLMTDMTVSFPLLNPVDGTATGTTATYGDAYAMIYSLYLSIAAARDGAQAPASTA